MDAEATNVELIRPYLPRLLLHWIGETPNTPYRALEGSIAFVDISGFTKLSERLAKRGKVGAEELTDAIGTCFTRLLAIAYGNGGSLLKFGGDALLLFFSGAGHAAKAARAAVGMRRELREIGRMDCSGVPVRLRMSVGIHTGTFHFFLVGESHRELIVSGPAASETVLMESTAEAGEIVVSQATASHLPANAVGAAKGQGLLLRREPAGLDAERPEPEPRIDDREIVKYVPGAVRDQLLGGTRDAEHRRVTIAFIHFDGLDELLNEQGPYNTAQHLDVLVRDVQRAVDRHGVSFLASDIDRDGGKIILTAGAPASSGNDEERMLLALREIVDGERRIPIRVGVNRGHVFAGDIGPFYRRTYTVMGDAVNLSARLMAKATAGQILSTEGVLELSHTAFASEPMEPFTVKGKARPIRASQVGAIVGGRIDETDASIPMIGREYELTTVLEALASAGNGSGRLVEVVGDPGIGKSRLLDELRHRAGDAQVFSVACELYGATTPYGAFRGLLRQLLGIREEDPGVVVTRLEEVLAALAPDLVPWAPLIAVVLDVEMPDTPETAALDEKFRRSKLNDVVADLMGRVLRSPTLIVFDDGHWMDETSADLVRRIERQVGELPWLICVARRGTTEGFVASEDPATTRIDLKPLDQIGATTMLTIATEEAPLRPDELSALVERSGGNPLYLKELVAAARTGGSLDSLPDSVEGLITARIDRLAPPDRNLLRRASVLGRSFPSDLLVAVLNGETPDASTWRRLSGLLGPDDIGHLRFENALIRDGAYEGLPYRLRRSLHAQVGETIEKAAGDAPDDEAELLSMHFFHAQRYSEAWRYSLVAAERAKAIYANVESAGFYERALEAARHVPDLVPHELVRVREELGDVRNNMGAFGEAAKAYTAVRRAIAGDPVAEARLLLKLSWAQGWLSKFSQALRWIKRGLKVLEGIDSQDAARQRAELKVWYARFLQEEGRHERAIEWCFKAADEAKSSGNRKVLADAYRFLDWAFADLGKLEKATYSAQALEVYGELGDLAGQGAVLNNMGTFAFWESRWSEALDLWGRAHDIAMKIGNPVDAAYDTNNIGEILADQGRLDDAEARFREAMRVWQAAGYRAGMGYAKIHLGRTFARAGRFDEAMQLISEGRQESADAGSEVDVLEADARIAECALLQGDPRRAFDVADVAAAHARALGGVAVQTPLLERVKGYALMQLGRLDTARDAFEESLRTGRARKADYDVALTQRGLAELLRCSGDPVPGGLEAEADATLERLGVVWVPEIPSRLPAAAKQ